LEEIFPILVGPPRQGLKKRRNWDGGFLPFLLTLVRIFLPKKIYPIELIKGLFFKEGRLLILDVGNFPIFIFF